MISNVKLSNLLEALTEEELTEFGYFINSPFYQRGQPGNLDALFRYILQKIRESSQELSIAERQEAFFLTFQDRNWVSGKLEKALSALHSMLKQYIGIRQRMVYGFFFEDFLHQLEFYRERGLKNRYENLRDQMLEMPEMTGVMNGETLRRRFIFHYELSRFEIAQNSRKTAGQISETIEHLEAQYLFSKIELMNQLLLMQKIVRFDLPETVTELIENGYYSEKIIHKNPILLLSYGIFQLLKQESPSIDSFHEIRQLFDDVKEEIDADYTKIFFTYLRNMCTVFLLHNNQMQFLPLVFSLSKEHYERGYLFYNGKIHVTTLFSISNTALRLQELDWAEQFIRENENNLLGDTPTKDYFNLALANLLFYRKKFKEIPVFAADNLTIVDFNLAARRLELKHYYETQSPMLNSKIDAFRMYISRAGRDILPSLPKKRNANFINLLQRINSTPPGNKKRIEKLTGDANSNDLIVEKEWLISILSRRK